MLALSVACRLLSAPALTAQPAWHLFRSRIAIKRLRRPSAQAMAINGRSSEADPAAAAAASPAAHLVWFRPGDLRLADHEPLHTAAICLQSQLASRGQTAGQPAPLLLPFFCLDERQLAAAPHSLLGLPQLGPHRLRWVALLLASSLFCARRSCTFFLC